MELIKEALAKAKAAQPRPANLATSGAPAAPEKPSRPSPTLPDPILWNPPRVQLDSAHLERQRVVAYARSDSSHVAFNVLRTNVLKALQENSWTSMAVTSPTAGCGKTMVAVNLALTMARKADCRTVLIDLDLRKPSVAKTLGIHRDVSIAHCLQGRLALKDWFVSVGENLIVGLNNVPVANSSEIMLGQGLRGLLRQTAELLRPDVMIFDLPPLLVSDEAIAILPNIDCGMLVAAAGATTATDLDECERQISASTNFLGVVLNKCEDLSQEYYYYGKYGG